MTPSHLVPRSSLVHTRHSAFSLVEVVLAVGVISFAFVAILGLLPAGLTQFRQAMDNSVSAQIAQRIITEAQESDFATLTNSANASNTTTLASGATAFQPVVYNVTTSGIGSIARTTRYFDEQGNEVMIHGATPTTQELNGGGNAGQGTNAKGTLGILYFVNTRITKSTSLPNPNVGGGGVLNDSLATITVQVAFNPSGKALSTPSGNPNYLLIDPTSLPRGTIKTYCAQIGHN